ncbi:MAG: helix-turn-helix domain-containing protein [Anaerolineae bacterium]|nr:helix-turn-helix domain-containing protein [Anaerolineae bacterium]
MPDNLSFGQWLKRQRRLLDLTQEELATRLGYAVTTVRRVEADELRPSKALAEKLADVLALPSDERDAFVRFARGERGAPLPLPQRQAVPTPPVPSAPPAIRHNLPIQLSSFIGREREMDRVQALLDSSRLVTLTGVGGTGKTRLALEVASRLVDRYPHGVWLVELAPLMDPALVPQAIATALTVRDEAGRSLLAALTDYLREKRLLLILDNCEHLIEACAQVVESLLRVCPQLQVVATGREALGLVGETIFQAPSLSLPERETVLPERLAQSEAIRLFVARAAAVQPGFVATSENLPSIAHICRTLDGIPLALELAAARVRSLPVAQIAARIDDRFRLLTGGSRTALSRQRTLQGLMDWSYGLLTEAERTLLQRLSVFAGGWALEAAEAVCADDEGRADVLDVLMRLVEKSLVQVESQGTEARYRLLETIRQYAWEKLVEAGEGERVRGRHLDYYLRLAQAGGQGLQGGQQRAWLQRIGAELENFRAAIHWSLDAPAESARPESGVQITWALFWYWAHTGTYVEASRYLDTFLALPIGLQPTPTRALALLGAQWLGFRGGDSGYIEESISLFRRVGDKRGLGWALIRLAENEKSYRRNFSEAARLLAESADLFQTVEDASGLAFVRLQQGLLAMRQGDYPEARDRQQESAALYKALGDQIYYSAAVSHIGLTHMWEGDYAAAGICFAERLAIAREGGGAFNIRAGLLFLGTAVLFQGDYEAALAIFSESQALVSHMGLAAPGIEIVSRGETYRLMGDPSEAVRLFREGLRQPVRIGLDRWAVLVALRGLAGLALEAGNAARAARLLGAVEGNLLLSGSGLEIPAGVTYKRDRDMARAVLGDTAFEAAWASGQAMTLEQAIAYALAVDDAEGQ